MIRLLDLPLELLIEILSYLGHKDLLKSRLVCREIYNTIKYSVELSYYIELAADDMVDGPRGPGTMDVAARYELLKDRRRRWRTLEWKERINVPVRGTCQAYELVGGVFAKSMSQGAGGSRHLITTWLPTSTKPDAESLVREDIGVPTRDFAIDPTQDLIALVNVDDSSPSNLRIRVHLRTISSNTPHKGAARSELQTPIPFQIGNCFIQIVADIVGMFFWLHGPGLVIWNWRKGETIVACLPHDGRLAGNIHAFAPSSPAVPRELHPGTWDFAFLSSRAYFLTTIGGRGSVEIYSMCEPGESQGPTSKHVASLLLPLTCTGVEMHHFSTHSSPFLGGDITKGKPFAASQGNRVHLMSFHYGQQGPRYHLFVKNSFLLGFVTKFDGERKTFGWEEWGPDNTRFLEHNVHFQWLRYVHGSRVVLPPLPFTQSTGNSPLCRACVLDFNVHPTRTNDPVDIGYPHGTHHPRYETLAAESVIDAGLIFEQPVVSRLPYSVASRGGPYIYSGFLIDEERLVGMKLSTAFVEGDLSDIDVFTF